MRYNYLGNSGLRVSELCFGAMSFTGKQGWTHIAETSRKEADHIVHFLLDQGVNFFDTADIYSDGASEIMLGKALGSRREEAIVATKCGFRTGPGPNDDRLSRRHIIRACEDSLTRLNTDYIDLYLVHSYDFATPLEETLQTFDQLVRDGKIRYIGISNFTAWQLVKAQTIQEKMGREKIINLQAYYSLLGRDIELEIVPACLDQGIGITVWGPLHGGMLSGKYQNRKDWPTDTRISEQGKHLPFDPKIGECVFPELEKIAEERDVSRAQISLNYLLKKTGISSVIIGARNLDQLKDNLATLNWDLTGEEISRLDAASEPGKIYPFWYFDIFRKERFRY